MKCVDVALVAASLCVGAVAQSTCSATWKTVDMDIDGDGASLRRLSMSFVELETGGSAAFTPRSCPQGTRAPSSLILARCINPDGSCDGIPTQHWFEDPMSFMCTTHQCEISGTDPKDAGPICCPDHAPRLIAWIGHDFAQYSRCAAQSESHSGEGGEGGEGGMGNSTGMGGGGMGGDGAEGDGTGGDGTGGGGMGGDGAEGGGTEGDGTGGDGTGGDGTGGDGMGPSMGGARRWFHGKGPFRVSVIPRSRRWGTGENPFGVIDGPPVEREQSSIPESYGQIWATSGGDTHTAIGADNIQITGCTQAPQPIYPLPPFTNNVISLYFKHFMGSDGAPGQGENLGARLRISPFVLAETRPNKETGRCETYVVMGDTPDEKPKKVVSVDGVAASCLENAYTIAAPYVMLDVVTALQQTTKASPGLNEEIQVVVEDSDGNQITSMAMLKYSYHSQLQMKLNDLHDTSRHRYKCWQGKSERWESSPATQRCTRYGISRSVNDQLQLALDSMSPSKIPFVVFNSDKDLQTGRAGDMDNTSPANWEAGCRIEITGLVDLDGNAMCTEPIPIAQAPPSCNFAEMDSTVQAMSGLLTSMSNGDMASDWKLITEYTSLDAWSGCSNVVLKSLKDKYTTATMKSNSCMEDYPITNANKDQYQGEQDFCEDLPNNPWCSDPCCNEHLQETLCCAARDVTYQVYDPEVDADNLMTNCPMGGAEIIFAIEAAMEFVENSISPDGCFEKKAAVEADVSAMMAIPQCCFGAVMGAYTSSSHGGGSYVSTQKCNVDNDCYSGSCQESASDSSESQPPPPPPSSSGCFSTEEAAGKSSTCNPVPHHEAGGALAKCLLDRLSTQQKTIAFIKKMFVNSQAATDAQIGTGIVNHAGRQTCQGDGGHEFDPENDCQMWNETTQECSRHCDSVDECKQMCLDQESCNWKPWSWSYNETTFESRHWRTLSEECDPDEMSSHFCAAEYPWGGIEDITERGKCQPNVGLFPETHGEHTWYSREGGGLTQAHCDSIGDGLSRVREYPHSNRFRCHYANLTSSRTDCYDLCSGDAGFKPPKKYECFMETDANGACPPGFFNERREDWELELPHGIQRPAYCTWNWWGHNSVRDTHGGPWVQDQSNHHQWYRNPAWYINLTNNVANGSYHVDSAEWGNIVGHSEKWDGVKFTNAATAAAICSDPFFGSQVRLADDGSEKCSHQDTCFHKDITTKLECETLMITNSNMMFRWEPTYNEGAGSCISTEMQATLSPRWWKVTLGSTRSGPTVYETEQEVGGVTVYSRLAITCSDGCNWGVLRLENEVSKGVDTADLLTRGTTTVLDTVSAVEAVAHPEHLPRDEGNGLELLQEDCFRNSWECDQGERQWGTFDHRVNWENSIKSFNLKRGNCSQSGGTFYNSREFREGKMDSQSKCGGSYCNVVGPRYSIAESQCTSIGGRCKEIDGCLGCREPWHHEIGESPKHGVCYKFETNSSLCTSGQEAFYHSDTLVCINTSVTDVHSCEQTWTGCSALSADDCSGGANSTAEKYLGNYLQCKRAKEPRFCTTKAVCEHAGQCDGPRLEDRIWVRTQNGHHEEVFYTDVCIIPNNMSTHRCPNQDCSQPHVDNYGDECWDPLLRELSGFQCADYRITSEGECSSKGGTWTNTGQESQKQFCTANKRCEGGRSKRGTHNRDETECLKCSGTMRADGHWQSGTWTEPAMVTGGQAWTGREMSKVNTWTTMLDQWRVRDIFRRIADARREEVEGEFTQCMYGQQAQVLKKVAAVCALDRINGDAAAEVFAADTILATVTAFEAVEETVGVSKKSNVQIKSDSIQEEVTIELAGSQAGRVTTSNGASTARRSTDSINDASCWSKVTNNHTYLVGQVLGNCVKMTVSGSGQLSNPVTMCLALNAAILSNPSYTVKDFVIRSGSPPYEFTPAGMTITDEGTQLCASTKTVNTYFCPALRITNWQAATSDTGTAECPALSSIANILIPQPTTAADVIAKVEFALGLPGASIDTPKSALKAGISTYLNVHADDVTILSVTQTSRRASGIEVEVSVVATSTEVADTISSKVSAVSTSSTSATALLSQLNNAGVSATSVSASEPVQNAWSASDDADGGNDSLLLIIIIVGGFVLLAATGAVVFVVCFKKKEEEIDEEKQAVPMAVAVGVPMVAGSPPPEHTQMAEMNKFHPNPKFQPEDKMHPEDGVEVECEVRTPLSTTSKADNSLAAKVK